MSRSHFCEIFRLCDLLFIITWTSLFSLYFLNFESEFVTCLQQQCQETTEQGLFYKILWLYHKDEKRAVAIKFLPTVMTVLSAVQ